MNMDAISHSTDTAEAHMFGGRVSANQQQLACDLQLHYDFIFYCPPRS